MSGSLLPGAGLRTESAGSVLLGGQPFRVLRLSPGGAAKVRSWFAGLAQPESQAELELAGRLVAAGLAHPQPSPARLPCHIVIPFHGSVDELEATLAPLRQAAPASITVVDDGSEPPIPPLDDVTLLRHDRPAGPGAARNTGWRHVAKTKPNAEIVVFLDGGVITQAPEQPGQPSWLDQLAGHLVDADVAAVAPRVASTPGTTAIDHYEQLFSPLDLGPAPSLVGPGRMVTYVPTACLMLRLADLDAADGFDESLRYGEDVDLIWRIGESKQVRYDPSVVVHHGPRTTLKSFATQRFHYASAAAPLDLRHPHASAPWRSSLVGVAGVALLSLGHPVAGMLIGFAPTTLLADQLRQTNTPTATSLRLLGAGHRWALRSFAESTCRSWSGVAAMAAMIPACRTAAFVWMAAGWMRRITATRSPRLLALGVVDDVSYGAGAAVGAARHRSMRSLLPAISKWG